MHRIVVIVALTALTGTVIAAPSAQAVAEVQCGQTISGAAHLKADLFCRTDGLTLLPGSSLDLRGFSLHGPGRGPVGSTSAVAAITVPDAGGVVVTNGTISYWDYGVVNTDDMTPNPGIINLTHLRISDTRSGILFDGRVRKGPPYANVRVGDVTFARTFRAIETYRAQVTVRRSSFTGSAINFPFGINALRSDISVDSSTFRSMDRALRCIDSQCVITNTTVSSSTTGLEMAQIPDYPAHKVTIINSQFSGLTTGVLSSRAFGMLTISGSRFTGDGIAVDATDTAVQMTNNHIAQGTTGFRYNVTGATGGKTATLTQNTLTGNHDGIYVDLPAAYAAGVRLGGNAANDNVDYGIYAPGATDLGGNTASGNGHTPQCVGVVCG